MLAPTTTPSPQKYKQTKTKTKKNKINQKTKIKTLHILYVSRKGDCSNTFSVNIIYLVNNLFTLFNKMFG